MRRRALEAKWLPRLQPYMNGQGLVPIRMTQQIQIGGSNFPCGQTHNVYWKFAAQLLAGVFAEVAKGAPKSKRGANDVAATLKAIARRMPRDD